MTVKNISKGNDALVHRSVVKSVRIYGKELSDEWKAFSQETSRLNREYGNIMTVAEHLERLEKHSEAMRRKCKKVVARLRQQDVREHDDESDGDYQ